jgi:GR25 family glycosyltransferase involved in LPS biosynthesis
MKISSFYDKIYVIHWNVLTERKEYLLSKFKEFELDHLVEFVELYQDEKSTEKLKNPFDINKKVLAVNMSHVFCFKQQIEKQYNNILIFEDDVDFEYIHLTKYLNQVADEFVKLNGDVAFLGSCKDLKPKNITPPNILYYDPSYGSKSCNSYIVNIKCTKKLIDCIINFHAIDIIFNQIIPFLNIRCLWSGLELKQGSETGKYTSAFVNIRDEYGNYKK